MASTLTRRNAEISFKALSLGAADYIPKPESTREIAAADIFKHDLIQKIRHLAAKRRRPATDPPHRRWSRANRNRLPKPLLGRAAPRQRCVPSAQTSRVRC